MQKIASRSFKAMTEVNQQMQSTDDPIEIIGEILQHLPLERQIQILEYSEFIFSKHLDEVQKGTYTHKEEDFPVTEELKAFLQERLRKHRENPEGAVTAEELEEEIRKEYSFEL